LLVKDDGYLKDGFIWFAGVVV